LNESIISSMLIEYGCAIAFKDAAVLGELTGPTAGLPVAGMLTRLAHTLEDD
jgi:hypothetical protein